MARCPECRRRFEVDGIYATCTYCGHYPHFTMPEARYCDTLWKEDPAPVEDAIERSRRLRQPVV